MSKKELEEKLKNVPKDKYIYQRYDGRIHKFLKGNHWLLDTETGLNVPEGTMLLGKVSENLIDLIQKGDFVNGKEVVSTDYENFIECGFENDYTKTIMIHKNEIKTILTKELYEANCYKVKEE